MSFVQVLADYDNPRSMGSRFRRRRSGPLREIITRVHGMRGGVSILDVGGLENYWGIFPDGFLREHNVRILLLNLERDRFPVRDRGIFATEVGDGCALPFEAGSFDICHSNSVIEHVGGWERKRAFAREIRRVAPSYFLQTPSFWFPVEPHFCVPFLHWLPEPTRLWLAIRCKLYNGQASDIDTGMEVVEHATLLTRLLMAHLFPDAQIIREKLAGVTKSFVAIRRDGAAPPV